MSIQLAYPQAFLLVGLEVYRFDDTSEWTRLEISSVQTQFMLNGVPTARVMINTGTLFGQTVSQASPEELQAVLNRLQTAAMRPARVLYYDNLDVNSGEAEPFTVFLGRVSGVGYEKSGSNINLVISLRHWLGDLTFCSLLSDDSDVTNPPTFRNRAIVSATSTNIGVTGFLPSYVDRDVFSVERIKEDIWGKSLHPMFYSASENDLLNDGSFYSDNCGALSKHNELAQPVLARFETGLTAATVIPVPDSTTFSQGSSSPWYVSSQFRTYPSGDLNVNAIATGLASWLMSVRLDMTAQMTFWDLLINHYCSMLKLAVVPRIETALISPVCPGLKNVYNVSFFQRNTTYISSNYALPRPVRGVGILPRNLTSTGGALARSGPTSGPIAYSALGACYVPQPDIPGTLLVRYAPEWMEHVVILSGAPTAAPVSHQARTLQPAPAVTNKTAASSWASMGPYYESYAKMTFAEEYFRGRTVIVETPLRWDVCPGSIIRVTVDRSSLGPGVDRVIGCVSQITHTLSVENKTSSTVFQLEHARSEEENALFGLDQHPLYENGFYGAPLTS